MNLLIDARNFAIIDFGDLNRLKAEAARISSIQLTVPEDHRTPTMILSENALPDVSTINWARCASVFGKHCGILILNSINLSSIEASSSGSIIRFSNSSFTEIAPNPPAARKLS